MTNDLSYDQRMQRIAGSLSKFGFRVLLVGLKKKESAALAKLSFEQERLPCFFTSGFLFYAEFSFRLFFLLLFRKTDILCAIDLDTILPVYFISVLKNTRRIYDAHELFTEMKEVVTRPGIHKAWLTIERLIVPCFPKGYTVNDFIAGEFTRRYGLQYGVIRNLPLRSFAPTTETRGEKWLLCQGAVNEGRCFESLIPAMKNVNARLLIIGNGNFFIKAGELVKMHSLEAKVEMRGSLSPADLRLLTPHAYIGITLFGDTGLNQYYSLANRFFDYMMAGIPQLCVNFPEYAAINKRFGFAYLIDDTSSSTIANALNLLLDDSVLYSKLRENAREAREILNWEKEESVLLRFYKNV